MIRRFLIVSGFMMSLCASHLIGADPMTVVLDPGHGGRDDGAVRQGVSEADLTLQVARRLADRLKTDRRFRVHLTRTSDQAVSLPERAHFATNREADVFVSIHVNSNPDSKARGAEFYFQNQLPPDEESMLLAHRENSSDESQAKGVQYPFLERNSYPSDVSSIVKDLLDGDRVLRSSQLTKALKIRWRGTRKSKNSTVRQAPFYVLSQMTTPSSLVELGFITNAEDLLELRNPQTQSRIAEDLYLGLVDYKESLDKVGPVP